MIISIILPIYNGEKYLEECLSSIATQTLDKNEYELIAINEVISSKVRT